MLPRSAMGSAMKTAAFTVLFAVLLVVASPTLHAGELRTRPLATTSTSSVTGINFAEPATSLPIDTRFSQSIQTVAFDLGLTCGQIEALGWSMGAHDQARVDALFTNTAVELNKLGYRVTPQDPSVAAEDITVYTATQADDTNAHKLFVWSAGDAGLLLLVCDAKGQLAGQQTTTLGGVGSGMRDEGASSGFGSYQSTPADIDPKKLIGVWEGTYTCRSQGQTGGRLTISKVSASGAENEHAVEGLLDFFPTPKNPNVERGSYKISGSFNSVTQQAYFEPGKWLKQPAGYISKPIIAYFDVMRGDVSAIFQDTTGCTSFEAHLKAGSAAEAASQAMPPKKKTKKKKKPAPKPVEPAPIIEPSAEEILPQAIVPDAPAAGTTAPEKTADTIVPETTGDNTLAPPSETTPKAVEPAPVTVPDIAPTPSAPVAPAGAAPTGTVPTGAVKTPQAETPKPTAPVAAPAAALGSGKPTIDVDPTKPAITAPAGTAPAAQLVVPNKTDAGAAAIDPMEKAKADLAAGEAALKKAANSLAVPAANEPKAEAPAQ